MIKCNSIKYYSWKDPFKIIDYRIKSR